MTMLPSQVDRLPITVEAAWGADLTQGFLSWPWSDESDSLDDQAIPIQRGRADEASQVQPATTTFELANLHGRFTPGKADGPLWPNVRRNTPCRTSVPGTVTHLLTDGTSPHNASTPDHSSLDITADIDLRYEGDIDWWRGDPLTAAGGSTLVGKYQADGNNRSYLLWVVRGVLAFSWSTDGTDATEETVGAGELVPGFIRVPWAKGRHAVGATIDVNDGAGHRIITFYTADSLAGPWSVLDQVILTGTTSIFSGSAPLEVGTITGELTNPPAGKTYGAQVIAGLAGSDLRANPDFTAVPAGSSSFVDSTGKTWTLNGAAEVTARRVRFFGGTDEITPTWPYGDLSDPENLDERPGEARVTITASGMLRRLNQGAKPLGSTLYRAVTSPALGDAVIAAWPMEDGNGSTSLASPIAGVAPMQPSGAWALASDSSLPAAKPLPNVSGGQSAGFAALVPLRALIQWMLTFFVRLPTAAVTETLLLRVDTGGTVRRWEWSITTGALILRGFDAAGNELFEDGAVPTGFFDGWTQVNLSVAQQGSNFVRSRAWFTADGTVVGGETSMAGTVGNPSAVSTQFTAPADGISFGYVAITTGLNGAWLGWSEGANNAYVNEPAGRRFLRLCAEEGVAAEVVGDPDLTEPMGPQLSRTLPELLGEAVAADLAIGPYEHRERPSLVMRTRRSLYNQVPTLVLDAAVNEIANPYAPVLDDQALATHGNDVTVTRVDGSSARKVDPAIDAGDIERYNVDTTVNVAADSQLQDQAGWRFHLGTSQDLRIPSVTSELTAAPRLLDDWLEADLGDRVHVVNLPHQHPAGPVDLLLQGYAEQISPTRWTPQGNCTAAPPWDVGVIEDEVLGRADTAGSQLYAPIADDDTALDVQVTEGPMWTTDNAQDGFDVRFGGEDVTVTDIAVSLVTFGAAGTASHADNDSVTPGLPASTAEGNMLLVLAGIRNSGTGVPNTPAGYTRMPVFDTDTNVQLFGKRAGSSESAPAVSFTGGVAGATTSAQMIRLAGNWADPAAIIDNAISQLNATGQDIAFPPLRVGEPNCIVLYVGWKQDDWTSVAAIGGATEIGEPSSTTGDDQGLVWDYVIQTTATNIAAGSFVVTGGATAISRGGVIALRCDRQTFTVTRSVNGVVKAHAVGTALSLADPMVAAL